MDWAAFVEKLSGCDGLMWEVIAKDITVRRAIRRGRRENTQNSSRLRVWSDFFLPARRALASLPRREGQTDPVFVNPKRKDDEDGDDWHEAKALNRQFARACREAKVRRRYAYQLRHTFATWALSSGENPAWIANQMGHTDVAILYKHYGKWMPQLDPKAGSRMLQAVNSKARRGRRAA
jgi:integrase